MPSVNPADIPGYFGDSDIGFVCDPRHVDASLPGAVNGTYNDFAELLIASGRLPPLGSAPVSAWVLARLAALCRPRFPFRYGELRGSDGDEYWLSFISFSTGAGIHPTGKLSLLGGRSALRLFVHAAPSHSPSTLRDAFGSALLAAPTALRPACVVVVYTAIEDKDHWKHVPYTLGWDGSDYLYHDSPEHSTSAEDYE